MLVVVVTMVAAMLLATPLAAATSIIAGAASATFLTTDATGIFTLLAIAATPALLKLLRWAGSRLRGRLAGAGSVRSPPGTVVASMKGRRHVAELDAGQRELITDALSVLEAGDPIDGATAFGPHGLWSGPAFTVVPVRGNSASRIS